MKLQKTLLFLYLFLLPLQLNKFFWPSWSYIYGTRIDYLAPSIYFTDFLFLVLLCVSFFKFRIKFSKVGLIFILVLVTNILFSTLPFLSFYRSARIVQAYLLVQIILNTPSAKKLVRKSLILAALWSSVLAILQVVHAGSLGGVLVWLGERPLSLHKPGIALTYLFGKTFLRPYSTFPHPNALSGFLAVVLLLALPLRKKKEYLWAAFLLFTIFLGFSQAVWFGLGVVLLISPFIKKATKPAIALFVAISPFLLSVLILIVSARFYSAFFDSQSLVRRAFLNTASWKLVSDKIFFGVGLGGFVLGLPSVYKDLASFMNSETYWWLQPVHNFYLLLLSEGGLLFWTGAYFLCYQLISRNKHTTVWLFILLTGLFDHYWLTSLQNLMLLGAVVGVTIKSDET